MKLGESPIFFDLCKAVLDYYENWDKNAYEPAATKRAIVAGANDKNTVSFVIFKGNEEDCCDIKKFLEKKDRTK